MRRMSFLLTAVLALALLPSAVPAAEKEHKGKSVSVTGCLQKGNDSNEYSLTGSDGKMFSLKSTSVNLSEHVGHKVTVTGKIAAAPTGDEKPPSAAAASGDLLDVSDLKMVSTSCQ